MIPIEYIRLKAEMSLTVCPLKLQARHRKFQQVAKSDDSLQTSSILGNWV